MKKLILLTITLFSLQINAQSLKTPAKSPLASIKQAAGLAEITVDYSRPSKSGRTVFGDVVPFGEVWRTGANASTKFTFGEDVKVNGELLKAGTYAVYTIPNKDEWTIIFNKNLTLWGSDGYSQTEDAARINVKTQKLNDPVETFTIQFSNTKPTQVTTDFTWDNTKVSFDITMDIDEKLMKNIDAVMSQDKRPYYQAAAYYYDNKKDMNKALEWATKAFEMNPKAYWVALLKAKIQLELKDKKGAIVTAEQAKKLAEEDKDPAYVKQAEELIQKAKAK
jgi:tetratricopeptide (TPR) repeat protein